MRKWINFIHLWLGMLTGLVVFIVSVTGCLYVFQEDICAATETYRYVHPQQNAFPTPETCAQVASRHFPGHTVHSVNYYGRDRSVEVVFYEPEPLVYTSVYIHPYTQKVLHINDRTNDFFYQVLQGHYYLWLPPAIGQPIVATGTLIFVVMLITGIILWWPKNKNARKQRFWFRWKDTTGRKRKNYDLHSIAGFYAALPALILALTGLVWRFSWFANAIHTGAGGKKSLVYTSPVSEPPSGKDTMAVTDYIWQQLSKEYTRIAAMEVHIPHTKEAVVEVSVRYDQDTYYRTDYRFFDQFTGKELEVNHVYGKYANADGADKLLRMNYDIHVGQIAGTPGKILAFLIALICASLPVTGFFIWRGRKKKTHKTSRRFGYLWR